MQKLKCDMDNMVMFGWVSNLKKTNIQSLWNTSKHRNTKQKNSEESTEVIQMANLPYLLLNMYYTHFVLQVVTVYGHQCWSRRSVSRWWWKVNYADMYNFWHFGDLADFLDAMTTVLVKLQLWLYQLCRHWWRMSAHFLLAFSTLFSHPYLKQQRYMFITHLYLLTTTNNNNNDRLTAFDPGQPG